MWTREWLGTEKGCFIEEVDPLFGRTIPASVRPYDDWVKDDLGQNCDVILPAIEPVV